jgi:DNA polymerase-4
MSLRVILHVDMDAFFASVEQHDHPEYRGKPVIVGAPPDKRGVVCAASYEARRFGVHSAMPSREAGRRCPHGIFVPPNGPRYADVSRQVFALFHRYTPLVEPLSIDEAFLDVTGAGHIFGDGVAIAALIRKDIVTDTGLTASVGVASNKFLAKLASDMDKPDGITLVPTEASAIVAFLAPLPVGRIWGVGKVLQQTLATGGFHLVRDLQEGSLPLLEQLVGARGAAHLRQLAFGIDERPLTTTREEKSMSREHTFAADCESSEVIANVVRTLVEDVGQALRKSGFQARVVRIKIRWRGFDTITRQRRLPEGVCDDATIRETALDLLEREGLDRPVRLIGVGVSDLGDRNWLQADLFDGRIERMKKQETLSHSLDRIRARFGEGSIGTGVTGTRSRPDGKG